MIAETLFEFHHRQPFVPFVINTTDGKSYDVDHPEVFAYVPGGRTAVLHMRGQYGYAWRHLDVSLITSLEPKKLKKSRRSAG